MTVLRSRRAGISVDEAKVRPVYARVLGLRYLRPGGLLCFLFFEGSIALGTLLALADLVEWWAVAVLPASVAAMVKLNDIVAGAIARAAATPRTAMGAHVARRPRTVAAQGSVGQIYVAQGYAGQTQATRGEAAHATNDPVSGGQAEPVGSAPEWVGSPEQRARQSATRRYE